MRNDPNQRLDTSFESIKAHLNPLLMSSESFARMLPIARSLPVFAVDYFGFECRLGPEAATTDCALNLTPDGARMLAGRLDVPAPVELQDEPWSKIRSFYQLWGDTREPAYSDARSTWLEFDTATETPSPNLLFGYWPRSLADRRPPEWLVDTILPLLLGGPISQAFRSNLMRCFDACPPPTSDFQVGVMLSRKLQVARLCIFDLPRSGMLAYLSRVGWKGPADDLQNYVDTFSEYADFIGLHLDIGEEVYPHIGVEPNFAAGSWARQPHREPRWFGQFEKLTELGLLTPEKKQALLDWIGYQKLSFGEQEILVLRGLSHIKVVIRPGAKPIAKAYFGIAHSDLEASS